MYIMDLFNLPVGRYNITHWFRDNGIYILHVCNQWEDEGFFCTVPLEFSVLFPHHELAYMFSNAWPLNCLGNGHFFIETLWNDRAWDVLIRQAAIAA